MKAYPALDADALDRLAERLGGVLAQEDGVEWAFGLGSCFEGLPHRDVDIAVRMSAGAADDLVVMARLAERCQAAAGRPVDLRLVPARTTDGAFVESVAAGRLLWARDADAAMAWAELVTRMSWDARALRRRARRDMREGRSATSHSPSGPDWVGEGGRRTPSSR
jgi:hypothetical protein